MKQISVRAAALLAMVLVLSGCIRVVNDVRPQGGNMDIADSGSTETDGTAGGAQTDEAQDEADDASAQDTSQEDTAEETIEEKAYLHLSEETYDEVKLIAANERFAVRNGNTWGVIDADGREVHPPEYDFIETDGNGLFSLTKKDGDAFDARLYYYDAASGEDEEVFTNEQYPEYDFAEFYTPFFTMSARGTDPLDLIYVEAEHLGGFEFEFYRHSKFDRNSVLNAGMNVDKWEAASGFMATMTSDGGSFVSSEDWVQEGAGYTNVVGIDGMNQIVLSEIERGRTLQVLPYAADEAGNFAGYIVEMPAEKKTLAYGDISDLDFAAAGLTAFPEEAAEVIPDYSSGTARAGRSGRAVIADRNGNEAIFNMETGKTETEFSYNAILLSGDNRYPSVAREGGAFVYITQDGKTRDAGEPKYTGASLYDEAEGYALVTDEDGNLYAIDRGGKRVSAKEEGFADSALTYLNGKDSHTFTVVTNGKVRICRVDAEE